MKKQYSNKIALIKNGRGVYSLDTIMGCEQGMTLGRNGCYDDCYAAKAARQYGYDFSKFVRRDFESESHLLDVMCQIRKADLAFIRVGTSGDPSEDWAHTFSVLEKVRDCGKDFVVITKHWNAIEESALNRHGDMPLVFNTSVSALDSERQIENALFQHKRLSQHFTCRLRVVTCDFNDMNPVGFRLAKLQDELLAVDQNYIDTVFRPSKSNKYVKGNVIKTTSANFLGKKRLVSKMNKRTYLGGCFDCPEQCGSTRYRQKQKQIEMVNL